MFFDFKRLSDASTGPHTVQNQRPKIA